MEFFLIISTVVLIFIGEMFFQRRKDRLRDTLREVAGHYNIPVEYRNIKQNMSIRYETNDYQLVIKAKAFGPYEIFFRFSASLLGIFRVINRSSDRNQESLFVNIDVGDPNFDRKLFSYGSRKDSFFAYLDNETRYLALELDVVSDNFELSSSWIKVTKRIYKDYDSEKIKKILDVIFKLNRSLFKKKSLSQRLYVNAKNDPYKKVRQNNLKALVKSLPLDYDLENHIKEFLEDDDIINRFIAAKGLGKEGLHFICNNLMADELSIKFLLELLKHIEESKYKKAIPHLKKLIDSHGNNDIAEAAIHAIGILGNKSHVKYLLNLYSSYDDFDIHLKIIAALGKIGTKDTVSNLKKINDDSLNPLIRFSVQKAVDKIQLRLGKVERGWVSIDGLEEKNGQLSLDSSNDGLLSVAKNNK